MNEVTLKANIAKAEEGFSNAKLSVQLLDKLPDNMKVSDGKGKGLPLPVGTHRVACIGIKRITAKSGDYDFCLFTVATDNGMLYDVSVEGEVPLAIASKNPKFTVLCNCVHNEKNYPIVTFVKNSSEALILATAESAEPVMPF